MCLVVIVAIAFDAVILLMLFKLVRLGRLIELVRYLCAVVALGVVVGAPFTLVMPVLRNFNDGERLFNTDIGWGLSGNMVIIFCCVPISSFFLDFELVNYFVTTGVTVSIVYFFGFGRSSFLSIKA